MKKKGYMVPDQVLLAKDINNSEKVLLAYLINRQFNTADGYEEDLTQDQLAENLGTSKVSISKAIKNLEKQRYIKILKIKSPETGKFKNFYRVSWERIEENEVPVFQRDTIITTRHRRMIRRMAEMSGPE